MPKKTSWLRSFPLHSFLFAAYPIVALFAFNVAEVDFSSGFRPLLLSLLLSGILVLVSYFVYRDWRRAALISTILLILFFSYGHVYILLKGINTNGVYLFRHRTLTPIWFGLAILMIWWASRKSLNVTSVTYTLNVIGLFLLILPLSQILSFRLQSSTSQAEAQKNTSVLDLNVGNQPPDIYYIILDGYGRADVLQNEYGYDNSVFLNSLRDLGFYIADCSLSNYAQTQLSLASALNFNYIDALSDRFVAGS